MSNTPQHDGVINQPPQPRRPRRFRTLWRGSLLARSWWIVLILLLGLWVRWPGMVRSVGEDEVNSYLECTVGFGFTEAQLANMVVMCAPTGFWTSFQVFKACEWLKWTGSVVATRLPILLVGLFGIWLGWRLGRLWRNWLLGFLLALLLALWPFKVTWDTQVRYYAVELTLMLAQILAAEAFRRNPEGAWAFILMSLLSLLAALSQPVAAALLALPWIYLAWSAAWRVMPLLRRRERDRRRWAALAGRVALQALLLGVVSLVVVQYNRGADWMVQKLESLGKPGPQVTLIARAQPKAPAAEKKGQVVETLPTPAAAWHFASQGFKDAFKSRAWSPAPLLGVEAANPMFACLVQGGVDWAGTLKPWAGRWLLIGILAGSLVLLFHSPPLLLSLWVVGLGTGLLMSLNKESHFIVSRYFAAPGLGGVILLAAALAGVLNLARWPLQHFRRPRGSAWLALGAALALGLWFAVTLVPLGRAAARVTAQNWLDFVNETTAKHPGATLYVGIESKNVSYYQQLAVAREKLFPRHDYWFSPRRSQSYDGYKLPWLHDAALLDRANAYDTLTFFNYAYWPYEFIPLSAPANQAWALPALTRVEYVGVKARFIELGSRIFITRGHGGLLLRPRLRDPQAAPAEASRRWRLDCRFEIPGEYELTITPPAGIRPVSLSVAGQAVALEKKPLAPAAAGDHPSTATQSGAALPFGLSAQWRPDPAEPLPLPRDARECYTARLKTPADPAQPLTVSLLFDQPPSPQSVPALEWRLREPAWQPLTAHFEAGTLRAWSDGQGFFYGAPLRLRQADGMRLIPRLLLVDATSNEVIEAREEPIEPERGLEAGDVAWLGTLTLNAAKARQLAGRTLALKVQALRQGPQPEAKVEIDPYALSRRLNRPMSQFCLTYLRFMDVQGPLRAQYAPPGE